VKFKHILALSSLLLGVFILCLLAAPLLVRGVSFAVYLGLLLAAPLAGVDLYFFVHRRLYELLEREDWPALAHYLEERLFRGGAGERGAPGRALSRGSAAPYVRLLANTYVVLADIGAVTNLEKQAAALEPSLVDDNALLFGAARLLSRDISGALRFFDARIEGARGPLRDWARWYYGFTLLLDRQDRRAAEAFSRLVTARTRVVAGLAGYFLGKVLAPPFPDPAAQGRKTARRGLPRREDWSREAGRIAGELHGAVIAPYLQAAGDWLYSTASGPETSVPSRERVQVVS